MNWFYALNNQQQGPITDEQLDQLIRGGVVRSDTLVWHEGMENWQPLDAARAAVPKAELPPLLPANQRQQQTFCVECRLVYPPTDLIRLNNCLVCATCKPKFIQRMMEGLR